MKIAQHIRRRLQYFPRQHLIVLGSLFLLLGISQLMLKSAPMRKTIELEIPRTGFKPAANQTPQQAATQHWQWHEEKVRDGDSLSAIFSRVEISAKTLHQVTSSSSRAKETLSKIRPKQLFRFAFDNNDVFVGLQYIPSQLERIDIFREADNSFNFEHIIKQPDIQLSYKRATLQSSLSFDGEQAGIPYGMVMKLSEVFGGVIDFIFDPRKGDNFDVLYEERFLDGKKIGNGNLLAASYTNEGETHTAYRYEFSDGRSGYFNSEGISMRKPFLRSPVDFTRISSGFNLRRKHPIHKKIKAHRGIDYAAPRGTPIFAVGDGRVTRAGYSKANGNYVIISHGSQYVTKYLHLDKRYSRSGQKVKQRTVIGTVGSTGYATGAHLHYEFLVNGVHRNPRTIFKKLPTAAPIPDEERLRFEQQIEYLQHQYNNLQLARAN